MIFSSKIMFCNKSNEILLFSPTWFRRRWPVEPRILQQVKWNIAFWTLFLSSRNWSKTHVLQQVKRNIAFFTLHLRSFLLSFLLLDLFSGSCFATSLMEYCVFTIFLTNITFHENVFFLMRTFSFSLFALKPV